MAPGTRTQAVLDPKTGNYKTFKVTDITEKVKAGLLAKEDDRKALKEKIYGTAKAESGKPKAAVNEPLPVEAPPKK